MNEQSAFYKAHSEELRRMAQNFERQLTWRRFGRSGRRTRSSADI